ncbi:ATP-binding protein [Brevibacillus nitrificans]|uniref:ATP-binding protein n=1 Tax=Brevibacillus nitrificans TaxID=651560 RepID=UPI002621A857|nr:sensor histidine kinase [Brevibacillus nitrificans]MED1796668.1 sensor histidine kinase [Brevibacillus nitrificans]
MRFHTKLMIMMGSLLIGVIVLLGISFEQMLDGALRKEIGTRALNTAKTIARMPEIIDAFSQPDPANTINPLVETIRVDTRAAFITVGNRQGIRYSHPDPEQIGKPMVGGDNEAVFAGHSIISETVGSLGPGLRGKTPIWDGAGHVIGVVSVGFLLEDIQKTIELYRDRIVVIGAVILLLGIMGTLWIARKVKESIFGLEPEQIGRMYQENQAVLESIREGIVAVNTEGAVTLANQTAMNLIGPSERQELLEEDQKEWLRSLRLVEVMQTGVAEFDQETFVSGKAVVVNRVPILDKERKVMGAVASFRDRSELFRVTQELSRVKEYAEALRSQTHEYSNKLHLISALIQLESYQEAVDFISAEVDVHVSNTQMIMRRIADPLIGGLLLGKVNQANERKIALTIDPDSHIPEIPAAIDRSLLIVILGNLIDNAMEAVCANGAHAKEVSVYLGEMDELLLVEIEDRGPGIPEAYASKVFERGFSTKQLQDHGYGLHLAKEAVEQLDGTISHAGNPQGGTIFTVTIPLKVGR